MKHKKSKHKLSKIKKTSRFSPKALAIYIGVFGIIGSTLYLTLAAGNPKGEPQGKLTHANAKSSTANPSSPTSSISPSKNSLPKTNSSASMAGTKSPVNDIISPTLSITSPTDGATVSGRVPITVNTADNSGKISRTELYIDSILIANNAISPYGYIWDSSATSNGTHTISIEAYDHNGNITSKTISVLVSNKLTASGPAITFLSPSKGTTVSGQVIVRVTASDASGVASIEISIDGVTAATCFNSTACVYIWNTTTIASGSHTIKVTAVNDAPTPRTSVASIQVTK